MPQNTTDPLSALGLIRDPASGSWSYTPQNLPTLSAEELGSMSNPQLRAHVYEQAQVTDARNRDAQLGKQAAGLNYGEQSMAVSREALEGFGTEARRAIDASYQQQLAGIDPAWPGQPSPRRSEGRPPETIARPRLILSGRLLRPEPMSCAQSSATCRT